MWFFVWDRWPSSCWMPSSVRCCSCCTEPTCWAIAEEVLGLHVPRAGELQDDRRLGEHLGDVVRGEQPRQRGLPGVHVGGVGDLRDLEPCGVVLGLVAGHLLVDLAEPGLRRGQLLLRLVVLLVRLVELGGERVDRRLHLGDARLRRAPAAWVTTTASPPASSRATPRRRAPCLGGAGDRRGGLQGADLGGIQGDDRGYWDHFNRAVNYSVTVRTPSLFAASTQRRDAPRVASTVVPAVRRARSVSCPRRAVGRSAAARPRASHRSQLITMVAASRGSQRKRIAFLLSRDTDGGVLTFRRNVGAPPYGGGRGGSCWRAAPRRPAPLTPSCATWTSRSWTSRRPAGPRTRPGSPRSAPSGYAGARWSPSSRRWSTRARRSRRRSPSSPGSAT